MSIRCIWVKASRRVCTSFLQTGDSQPHQIKMKTRHTLFGGAQDKDRAFEEKTSLLRIQNTVILSEVDFTMAQRAKRFSLLEKKATGVCVCVCSVFHPC